MLNINLLPSEMRKRRRRMVNLPPSAFLVGGGGGLAFLLLAVIILALFAGAKKGNLARVDKELRKTESQGQAAMHLKKEKETFNKKMVVVEQLMDKRILWAEKLDRLNELIPTQIWLTSLYIQEDVSQKANVAKGKKKAKKEKESVKTVKRTLVLKGAALSKAGETSGLKLVGDFMDALRSDDDFYKDFVKIGQRGPLRWGKSGELDVMYFELGCRFKGTK